MYNDVKDFNLEDFDLISIIDIEDNNEEKNTYDIEVDEKHYFYIRNPENKIEESIVSHNTAEIVFGDPEKDEYLDLKNYNVNKERNDAETGWGWTSNNSIFAEIGMDYKNSATRTKLNGEPGYAWLQNMKDYGRMCDPINYKDHRVAGANPCNEQSLESFELCCLVENFINKHDDLEDFIKTLKYSYLYAKTITLGKTHWPETNKVMLRNRRIGSSLSGLQQFVTRENLDTLKTWLNKGYEAIQKYDELYSDWLAIPRSIKTTSIKPSGSVSKLVGATAGMHWPVSKYCIKNMRLSKHSELIKPLKEAGYKLEPSVNDPDNTLVVSIPYQIEEDVRSNNKVSMWEQLHFAAFLQEYWADNQVSCTVEFDPETEGDQIEQALNYFQYKLKGVSFLPRFDYGAYPQMPEQVIDEKEFKKLNSKIKPLNLNDVKNEEGDQEKFCSGETCEIDLDSLKK